MDIKYLGHASFFIKTKNARIVTDPYDNTIGLKFPKTEADIVTISHHHPDHNQLSNVTGKPLVIDWPGEFEKQGVRITGYLSYHDKKKGNERGENVLFKFESEGIQILHCGDLGLVLDESFVEKIGEVDVLMIPVGGFYTIDPGEAVEVIKKIEPSLVIPMHYNTPAHNPETFAKLATVADFLQKMGAPATEPVTKLTLKKEDLDEQMKVVVMEREKE